MNILNQLIVFLSSPSVPPPHIYYRNTITTNMLENNHGRTLSPWLLDSTCNLSSPFHINTKPIHKHFLASRTYITHHNTTSPPIHNCKCKFIWLHWDWEVQLYNSVRVSYLFGYKCFASSQSQVYYPQTLSPNHVDITHNISPSPSTTANVSLFGCICFCFMPMLIYIVS